MRLEINGITVETYEGLDMPISNYEKFNQLYMVEAGIGGDLPAYQQKINLLRELIPSNPQKALTVLQNLSINVSFIEQGVDPELKAFCAIISEIDGRKTGLRDLTEQGLLSLEAQIRKANPKKSFINRVVSMFKKKVEFEIKTMFPEQTHNVRVATYAKTLHSLALERLERVITGKDTSKKVKQLEAYLLRLVKPVNFIGADGAEVTSQLDFENACLLIRAKNLHQHPEKMSVRAFINTLNQLKKIIKK